MRIEYSHPSCYSLYRLACKAHSHSELAGYRSGVLQQWERLKSKQLSDVEISQLLGISRATYYRHKRLLNRYGLQALERRSRRPKRIRQSQISASTRQRILMIRQANPTYGKLKINRILLRDYGIVLSDSSVGRVLSHWMKAGKIENYAATKKVRRVRRFKGHAQRWSRDLKAKQPGSYN